MLKECIEVFKSDLENNRKRIIHGYVPADGTYVIVSPKGESFEIKDYFDIKIDKKEKKLIGITNANFRNICEFDYNSKLIDMNKPIDGKKIIHSNNYLSFFIKKESLENGKLTQEIIDNYYATLEDPIKKYEKNKRAVTLYKSVEDEIGKVDTETIKKIRTWIKENIFNLNIEISGKDYLKIFFEYPIGDYINEGKRYLIPNIYNNNDCNIELREKIYGLPNNNMGLNAKKPYLENKTRKNTFPYLIDAEEVQVQKEFFDYLINEASIGRVNVFVDTEKKTMDIKENSELPEDNFSGLFLRIKKGKEVEIHDFDTITAYKSNLKKNLNVKNILNLDLEKYPNQKYTTLKNKRDVQSILDEVFFSKYLINNYFTDSGDMSIKDSVLKNNILISRYAIFNWIYKGIEKGSGNGIVAVLDKVSLNIIKNSINNGFISKAAYQFNLRWSLKEYFEGGDNMADIIQDIKSALRGKINNKDTDKIDNDKEYYFAIGQLVSYLLSKSKGKKKPHSLANQFVNSKNNEDIKEKLRKLYVKYSYDPDINGKRFNNLYAMIVGYVSEGKVDNDLMIAGYLNSNLIYEKNEGEN